MNGRSTSLHIVTSPSLQRAQFSFAFIAPGSTTSLYRDDISGDSNQLFVTKVALFATKAFKECDESHDDLTRPCGEFLFATSAALRRVYRTWMHPRRWIEVTFQVTRPDFSSTNRGLVCGESH